MPSHFGMLLGKLSGSFLNLRRTVSQKLDGWMGICDSRIHAFAGILASSRAISVDFGETRGEFPGFVVEEPRWSQQRTYQTNLSASAGFSKAATKWAPRCPTERWNRSCAQSTRGLAKGAGYAVFVERSATSNDRCARPACG